MNGLKPILTKLLHISLCSIGYQAPALGIEPSFETSSSSILIQNVRIADGRSSEPGEITSIFIKNGLIVDIAPTIEVSADRTLDFDEAYVSPGMIDSHVHLMWSPGCSFIFPKASENNWRKTCGMLLREYLRGYLASGFTTIVDNAVPRFVVDEIERLYTAGAAGPQYHYMSPVLYTPGGYGSVLPFGDDNFVGVTTPEDVKNAFSDENLKGSLGVKVLLENNFFDSGILSYFDIPTHSDAVLEEINKKAREKERLIFVHVTSEYNMSRALEHLRPDTFVHTLIGRESPLSSNMIEKIRDAGIYQSTTQQIADSWLTQDNLQKIERPFITSVVPEPELLVARDPTNGALAKARMQEAQLQNVPWFMKWLVSNKFQQVLSSSAIQNSSAFARQALANLHKAGVPIVLGSDSLQHPFAIYTFHGASSVNELLIVSKLGLSPFETLKAATITPAQMLGLDDEIGTVEIGKKADLLILTTNPHTNIEGLANPSWVVKAGVAKTPAEWMATQ